MRRLVAGAAASLLLAGCGGGPDRPSVDELTPGIEPDHAMAHELGGDQLSEEMARCLAEVLVESEVSDDALRDIAAGRFLMSELSGKDGPDRDAYLAESDRFLDCR